MGDLVSIDGSYGEGGGQVLRTCLSLSAITGRPVEINRIRGGRARPGMQAQHLVAVRAAAQICGATVTGAKEGSLDLLFEPSHNVEPGDYRFDIGTAGSTTLVAQTLIVPLSLAGGSSQLTIRGGTHNPMAPTSDYLAHVYAPTLREFGYRFEVTCDKPGFYPRGGGELRVEIDPAEARKAITFAPRHESPSMTAYIVLTDLPASIADRAEKMLHTNINGIVVMRSCSQGIGPGAALTITLPHAGFCSLGVKGKMMESVTSEAIEAARSWIDGVTDVDEHLADQLVLPALFAHGQSRWSTSSVTEHLRTVIWVADKFFDLEYNLSEESRSVVMKGGHGEH